jgi:hypothetical protein
MKTLQREQGRMARQPGTDRDIEASARINASWRHVQSGPKHTSLSSKIEQTDVIPFACGRPTRLEHQLGDFSSVGPD